MHKSLCFLKTDYTGGRTVKMTGTGSIKTPTLFLAGNYGDCRPSLSDVGIETPFS